jgi:serine protease Do
MATPDLSAVRAFTLGVIMLTVVSLSGGLPASVSAKETDQDSTVKVYKKVVAATVLIASVPVPGSLSLGGPINGVGAGVLLDEQGFILTTPHVIEAATSVTVVFHDGTRAQAEVVGSDPVTDVALLRVALPKGQRVTAQLGDSDRVEIGQKVLAIGHPFGLGYALTTGIVSGFVLLPETSATFQDHVIQISAAINPGNSGGPLVNEEGQVIGLTSAMLAGAQSIGFAIPINTAKLVAAELRTNGRVIRPWLGIGGKLVSVELITLFALALVKVLLFSEISAVSPAEKVGLQTGTFPVVIKGESWLLGGDILVSVNGQEVRTPEQYRKVVKRLEVGRIVELGIMRHGRLQRISVMVEERPLLPSGMTQPKGPERVDFQPLVWASPERGPVNADRAF